MVFNSYKFIVFLFIVYSLYLILNHRRQNRLLLIASYVFYAAWDWRFLSLIVFSTFVDFFCGIKVFTEERIERKRFFLGVSVIFNLSVLFFFKYFNFFIESMQGLFGVFGFHTDPFYLNIILPMGISFYTFQTMSYTIDIYRKEMKPTLRFLDFALFVSFFPQLVAGPIERAKNLLPQILSKRNVTLDKFYEGTYLIFWGIFQKVFIADNLANIVNPVFSSSPPYNGIVVLAALYAFTFQIYCDFAGYSNIARGLGKIMGFDIMINFNLPFFVTNIQDFWNKWHISLSTWIRDYLYMPLIKGLKMVKGNARIYLSLILSMVIIGVWHGADWNFVVFGSYYGILLALYVLLRSKYYALVQPKSKIGQGVWTIVRMVFMFHIITIGMMLFRVEWGQQIYHLVYAVLFNFKMIQGVKFMMFEIFFYSWILIAVQLLQYYKKDLMALYYSPVAVKTSFYVLCYILLMIYGVTGEQKYIYFQF